MDPRTMTKDDSALLVQLLHEVQQIRRDVAELLSRSTTDKRGEHGDRTADGVLIGMYQKTLPVKDDEA